MRFFENVASLLHALGENHMYIRHLHTGDAPSHVLCRIKFSMLNFPPFCFCNVLRMLVTQQLKTKKSHHHHKQKIACVAGLNEERKMLSLVVLTTVVASRSLGMVVISVEIIMKHSVNISIWSKFRSFAEVMMMLMIARSFSLHDFLHSLSVRRHKRTG